MSKQIMPKQSLGHLFAFITNACYGMNFLFLKVALLGGASPLEVALCRVMGACMFFILIYLTSNQGVSLKRIPARHWVLFFIAGICGTSLNQITILEGVQRTSVIHASSVSLLFPLLVVVIEKMVFKQLKLGFFHYVGMALGVLGAVLLVAFSQTNDATHAKTSVLGDFLVFLNFVLFAGYLVILRVLVKTYSPKFILMCTFSIGLVIILLGCVPLYEEKFHFGQITPLGYVGILGCVFFASIIAQMSQNESLKYISATISSSYIYMQPIVGSLLAIIFLGERAMLTQLMAFACMSLGLYFTSFRDLTKKNKRPKKTLAD